MKVPPISERAACVLDTDVCACMLLVSMLFWHFNPYTIQHFSEIFFALDWFLLCVATRINLLTFVQTLHTYKPGSYSNCQ